MDIKDMFSYFCYLKSKYELEEIIEMFENDNYEINKLDISRIYRFLDNILVDKAF